MAETNYNGVAITPAWHQSGPYNWYVPWNFSFNRKSVTGCVATAVSQVVWSWLNRGYTDDITITLTADNAYSIHSMYTDVYYVIDETRENAEKFGYLPFDDVNAILASENIYTNEYIAALNFAVGVYHNMVYDDWDGAAGSAIWDGFYSVIGMGNANYSSSVTSWDENLGISVISDAFYEIMIENLLAGCPLVVSNWDHAYVIDGYNSYNDTFHVNWGDGKQGAWHSRASLNTLGSWRFIYDIMPKDYLEFDFTVTDCDYYGTGTLKRVIEYANANKGWDEITFDIKDGKITELPFLQSYESLTINNFDCEIVSSFSSIYVKDEGMSNEEVLTLNMDNFKGKIITARSSYMHGYSLIEADRLNISFNNAALVNSTKALEGLLTIQQAKYFNDYGFSGIRDNYFYCFGSSEDMYTHSEYKAIVSGYYEDNVLVDNKTLIIGSIDLNGGQNSLKVLNGSMVTHADEIDLGDDNSELIIDSTSKVAADYLSGNADITFVLKDIAADEMLMASHFNFNTITIDATKAVNGTYTLIKDALYEIEDTSMWEKLTFIIKDKSGDYTLKLGETKNNFSISIGYTTDVQLHTKVYNTIEFTVSNYTHDTTAPTAPKSVQATTEVNRNTANLSWKQSTDDLYLDGYYVRYGKLSSNLDKEVFFDTNSGKLTDLSEGRYYYQVGAVDRSGNITWSSINNFMVTLTDKTVPEISNVQCIVSENLETNYFDLNFTATTNETCTYRVKIAYSKEGAISSNIIYDEADWGSIFDNKYIGVTFYYTVQAVDLAGNASEWSEVKSVTLEDKIAPVNMTITSSSLVKNNEFKIDWTEVKDFTSVKYEFEFATKSDFSNAIKYSFYDSVLNSSENTFYLPQGTFYWRYRTVDGSTNASNWTANNSTITNSYFINAESRPQITSFTSDVVLSQGVGAWEIIMKENNLNINLQGNNKIDTKIHFEKPQFGIVNGTINLNGDNISACNVFGKDIVINVAEGVDNFTFAGGEYAWRSQNSLTVNGNISGVVSGSNWGIYVEGIDAYKRSYFTVNGDIDGIILRGINAKFITVDGDISGFVSGGISSSTLDCMISGIVCGNVDQSFTLDKIQEALVDRDKYLEDLKTAANLSSKPLTAISTNSDSNITLVDDALVVGYVNMEGNLSLKDSADIYGVINSSTELNLSLAGQNKLIGEIRSDDLNLTINGDSYFEGSLFESSYSTNKHNYKLLLTDNNLKNCSINLTAYHALNNNHIFTVNTDNLSFNGKYKLLSGDADTLAANGVVQVEYEGNSSTLYCWQTISVSGISYSLIIEDGYLKLDVSGIVKKDIKAEESSAITASKIQITSADELGEINIELANSDALKFYNYGNLEYSVNGNSANYKLNSNSEDSRSKLVKAEADEFSDVFFVKSFETWSKNYCAQHVGSKDGNGGTGERVSLAGKNKICDIFVGADDPNILYLTDDSNGDAIFVEDIFSDSYKESKTPAWAQTASRLLDLKEIRAGKGDDVIDLTSDKFTYQGGKITIRGGNGNDTVWGNDAASNYLFGDKGNDRLVGGAKSDIIVGGSGDDSLHGGGGEDYFFFGGNFGNDKIEQFAGGSINLVIQNGKESNWNAQSRTYSDGTNSIQALGSCQVNLIIDTSSYTELALIGVFGEFSTQEIFEEENTAGTITAVL